MGWYYHGPRQTVRDLFLAGAQTQVRGLPLLNIPEADYPDSGISQRHRPSSPFTQLYERSGHSRSGPTRSTRRVDSRALDVSHGLPYKGESRRDDFESRRYTTDNQKALECDFGEMVLYDPALCDQSQNGIVRGRNQSENSRSQSGRRSDYYHPDVSSGESDSESGSEYVTVLYDKDSKNIDLLPDKVYRFVHKKKDGKN